MTTKSSIHNTQPIPSPDPITQIPTAVQSLFTERRLRLEKERKQKEDAERTGNKTKNSTANAHKAPTTQALDSARAIQAKYAAQSKKDLAEEKKHKEQILARIERDKVARREREVAEKERRQIMEREQREAEAYRRFLTYGDEGGDVISEHHSMGRKY